MITWTEERAPAQKPEPDTCVLMVSVTHCAFGHCVTHNRHATSADLARAGYSPTSEALGLADEIVRLRAKLDRVLSVLNRYEAQVASPAASTTGQRLAWLAEMRTALSDPSGEG